jgi:hypothetical protein
MCKRFEEFRFESPQFCHNRQLIINYYIY